MIEVLRKKIQTAQVKKSMIEKSLVELSESVTTLSEHRETLQLAQALCQKVAQSTQETLRFSLEKIVNLFLTAIFDGMYEFKLIFEISRSRTTARIALIENGIELDPEASVGGGVMDVLATALRIAMLLLSKNDRVLLLDEPGKFISVGLRPRFYEVMRRLSHDMGIQIIMVTHDSDAIAIADHKVAVRKVGMVSTVE
jgi:ABC-type sugar transport system ATPase subunit